jgi:hypothetical protein
MKSTKPESAKPESQTVPAPEPKTLPPTAELARLAATLAHGRPISSALAGELACQAMELWLACEQAGAARNRESKELAADAEAGELLRNEALALTREQADRELKELDALPSREKFPIKLDAFLKAALPDERAEDRAKIFREFTRKRLTRERAAPVTFKDGDFQFDGTVIENAPKPSDDDCVKERVQMTSVGIGEGEYPRMLLLLRKYAVWWHEQNKKARARAGGSAVKQRRFSDSAQKK